MGKGDLPEPGKLLAYYYLVPRLHPAEGLHTSGRDVGKAVPRRALAK